MTKKMKIWAFVFVLLGGAYSYGFYKHGSQDPKTNILTVAAGMAAVGAFA